MVNPDRNLYDPPYDDALLYDNELEPERPRSRPLVVLLGFVVLAAFSGVVWVAYNQGVQQGARGVNPPVLAADPGPTRIEPDQLASVPSNNPAPEKTYERLWASTNEQPGQENVLPTAEQPRSIASTQDVISGTGDTAGAQGGPAHQPPPVDPRMDATVDTEGGIVSNARPIPNDAPTMTAPNLTRPSRNGEDITSSLPNAESAYIAEAEVTPPRPITPAQQKPTVRQTPPSTGAKLVAPANISPRSSATQAPLTLPGEAEQPSSELPSDLAPPAAATGGNVSIQLGSFPTSQLAAAAWSKVKSSNQEILGEYSPQIVSAKIDGKGTWYRLRVGGFSGKSAAKDVCDQLQAGGHACIIAGK